MDPIQPWPLADGWLKVVRQNQRNATHEWESKSIAKGGGEQRESPCQLGNRLGVGKGNSVVTRL